MHVSFASHRALADSLWRFSLAVYSRPGVAQALLTLQDRDGADVNIVLFGLWLGAVRGAALSSAMLREVAAAIDPVQQAAILPLRNLRRSLSQASLPDIRARVLSLELAAERTAQSRLAEFAMCLPDDPNAAERLAVAQANLTVCLGAECVEADILMSEVMSLTRRS